MNNIGHTGSAASTAPRGAARHDPSAAHHPLALADRRPALVVVDVQNGFVDPDTEHVVPVIVDLVARWQAAGGDVVFTRYHNYEGSLYVSLIGWDQLMDAPQTDLVEELEPYVERAAGVVDKHSYDMLASPEGASLVAEHDWTDLYICGIATESCVTATALGAFQAGRVPWIIEDASTTHAGQHVHEAGILVASRFIGEGQIVRTADLPEHLLAPVESAAC